MKIAIGADHAAFTFKEQLKAWLLERGYDVTDFGTFSTERVDYPEYGRTVGEAVANGEYERGVICCGTGVGISIAANKVRGVRCVVCSEPYSARLSRAHNDTDILSLGSRVVGLDLAEMILEIWLATPFEGGRHAARLEKISKYEHTK